MKRTRVFSLVLCGLVLGAMGSALAFLPREVQAQAAVPPSGTEAAKRGAEILAAGAQAAGGDAVKTIESLQLQASGSANLPTGPLNIVVKVLLAYPDRARVETDYGMGSMTNGFDGKSGWVATPQGNFDVPADMSAESLRGIDLTGALGVYKKSLAGKAEAEFVGEQEVEGKQTVLVEWTGPSGKVKLYFDAQTKLLVAAKYRALTMQGAVEEERRWSDFREVDGVKFPFRWVTYRDGGLYSDLTLNELKLNAKIEASAFDKPQ